MPQIKVVYWNIENFGNNGDRRGNNQPLCNFIAAAVQNVQPDVIFLQEVLQGSGAVLALLQQTLSGLAAPLNNWYYDFVPGCLGNTQTFVPAARAYASNPPFNLAGDVGFNIAAHNEGYAVFWNQNIAKFLMQTCTPVPDPRQLPAALPRRMIIPLIKNGISAVTQSDGVRTFTVGAMGAVAYGQAIPAPAIPVAAGGAAAASYVGTPWMGVRVPALPALGGMGVPRTGNYELSAGTVLPAMGNIVDGAGLVVPLAGAAAVTILRDGDVIPAGTTIGAQGLALRFPGAHAHANINRVVIPGGYVLPANFTLPPAETCVVPPHCIQLEVFGRPSTAARYPYPGNGNPPVRGTYFSLESPAYTQLGAFGVHNLTALNHTVPPAMALFNEWAYIPFPRANLGNALLTMASARRPAYSSMMINTAAGAELLQMVVYHAPSHAEPADLGIQMLGMSKCLYEGYNWGGYAAPPVMAANAAALPSVHHVNTPLVIPAAPLVRLNTIVGGDWNIASVHPLIADLSSFNKLTRPYVYLPLLAMPPAPNNMGGANLTTTVIVPPAFGPMPADRNTIFRLTEPVIAGNPVLSADFDDYKTSSIDNIFFRINPAPGPVARPLVNHQFTENLLLAGVMGAAPAAAIVRFNADVYDLVKAVIRNMVVYPLLVAPAPALVAPTNFFIPNVTVQGFNALPLFHPGGVAAAAPPVFVPGANRIPQYLNAAQLLADINAGNFAPPAAAVNIDAALVGLMPAINIHQIPGGVAAAAGAMVIPPARLATEFIKKLVSDHLPVIFTMNF